MFGANAIAAGSAKFVGSTETIFSTLASIDRRMELTLATIGVLARPEPRLLPAGRECGPQV